MKYFKQNWVKKFEFFIPNLFLKKIESLGRREKEGKEAGRSGKEEGLTIENEEIWLIL